MIWRILTGAVLALAVTSGGGRPPHPHGPVLGKDMRDSRRRSPGVHRASPAELAVRDRVAREESAKLHRVKPQLASVPATTWVPLGPSDAFSEFNFVTIQGVDSGRPNNIAVDPRDGNVVYMAVSGGGLWKSFDFLSAQGATWNPLTDTLPNLAIGALALDPENPDRLFIGNGDFIDASGDTMLHSSDGGATWSAPVKLAGKYVNGFTAEPRSIRQVNVHGDVVLAGTDVGLFRSTDGGDSYTLVELPSGVQVNIVESVWSVVQPTPGHWIAAGVSGCGEQAPANIFFGCSGGSGGNARVWTSEDDGATWKIATLPAQVGTGRITVDASKDVAYAFVASDTLTRTLGFWRSDDGGKTWVDATGKLANPTHGGDCGSIDVGHDQSWYNQAIVVDPTNPDHVLVGGNLCGMRTLNGRAASPKWENVSYWLPGIPQGQTDFGSPGYVHADWHTALSTVVNGKLTTFAGTDGGIFTSTNLFDSATKAEAVEWTDHNKGLVTHLCYAIGSGDPTTGNPFVVFSGLQDNGTRFRETPANPSVFDQPVGGDGIGATVHVASSGTTFWASVEFGHAFCKPQPGVVDCADGRNWSFLDPVTNGREEDDDDEGEEEEVEYVNKFATPDSEPFFIHYANVETDTVGGSVLTHTNGQIFVATDDGSGPDWAPISQDVESSDTFTNVSASRTVVGLYGATGFNVPFYTTTTGNTPSTWKKSRPVIPAGATVALQGASSIDFPPVTPAGKNPGDVFIGSFTGVLGDAAQTPPPDDQGRVYRTEDGGRTFTSIVGADPARRLPNVAVYVVKYDPVAPATIYAGTDLGVYFTTDDGANWDRMGDGFPVVPARDIYVAKNQDFIRVATYGRGLWEIYPSAAANQGVPGNGDYDRSQAIDWVDVAAMATRLGDTPATADAPLYTWILDVTGATDPLALIDDVDLTALMAKLGGHP